MDNCVSSKTPPTSSHSICWIIQLCIFLNFLVWKLSKISQSRQNSTINPIILLPSFNSYQHMASLVSSATLSLSPPLHYLQDTSDISSAFISSVNHFICKYSTDYLKRQGGVCFFLIQPQHHYHSHKINNIFLILLSNQHSDFQLYHKYQKYSFKRLLTCCYLLIYINISQVSFHLEAFSPTPSISLSFPLQFLCWRNQVICL